MTIKNYPDDLSFRCHFSSEGTVHLRPKPYLNRTKVAEHELLAEWTTSTGDRSVASIESLKRIIKPD